MTKQDQKIKELEQRIAVLEAKQTIVNVYPGYQLGMGGTQTPITPSNPVWTSNTLNPIPEGSVGL